MSSSVKIHLTFKSDIEEQQIKDLTTALDGSDNIRIYDYTKRTIVVFVLDRQKINNLIFDQLANVMCCKPIGQQGCDIEIVEGRKTPSGISTGETEWVRLQLGGISGKLSTSDEQGNEITYEVHRKIKHREFITHIVKKIKHANPDFNDRNQTERGNTYHIHTKIANPLKSIADIEKFLCDHVRGYKS